MKDDSLLSWFVHFNPQAIQTPDPSGSEFAVIRHCLGGGGVGVVVI